MKFEDMKLGDRFECWGDLDLGAYNYPKICLVEKDTEHSVIEIYKNGERGQSCGISGGDFQLISETPLTNP